MDQHTPTCTHTPSLTHREIGSYSYPKQTTVKPLGHFSHTSNIKDSLQLYSVTLWLSVSPKRHKSCCFGNRGRSVFYMETTVSHLVISMQTLRTVLLNSAWGRGDLIVFALSGCILSHTRILKVLEAALSGCSVILLLNTSIILPWPGIIRTQHISGTIMQNSTEQNALHLHLTTHTPSLSCLLSNYWKTPIHFAFSNFTLIWDGLSTSDYLIHIITSG